MVSDYLPEDWRPALSGRERERMTRDYRLRVRRAREDLDNVRDTLPWLPVRTHLEALEDQTEPDGTSLLWAQVEVSRPGTYQATILFQGPARDLAAFAHGLRWGVTLAKGEE